MLDHIKVKPWKIIEESFSCGTMLASESIFSIGNGAMGGRASFEEDYSGDSLKGNYIGGVYYPDKTRVGWWKIGYPEYFGKVLNSAFWIGISVKINGENVDLAKLRPKKFYRELDMRHGLLYRSFTLVMSDSTEIEIECTRFVSLDNPELGAVNYNITPLNGTASIELVSYIDGDVRNEDSNYSEKFWELIDYTDSSIRMRTKKSNFEVCWAMENDITVAGTKLDVKNKEHKGEKVYESAELVVSKGETVTLNKYVGVTSSMNHPAEELHSTAKKVVLDALPRGFDALVEDQKKAWVDLWGNCDVEIDGDDEAQQAVRFCIFQLLQTYNGSDSRLNIGPKGFTGEKYGGGTYWDTEAYCFQFYMSAMGNDVARNLLLYRYDQLDKAIDNAKKIGMSNGAALYPMVTVNGEECHSEWEVTFEELHRNGAIAYAIYNYIKYSGDTNYLCVAGAEVLIGISRFWAQRVSFSKDKNKYVILGVTGPNEYENNVNNNWYTNFIARWTLRYTRDVINYLVKERVEEYNRIQQKTLFDIDVELDAWSDIINNIFLPYDKQREVFLQHEGFLDKELRSVDTLKDSERPINQHWSWDRILRSCFIKQADVVQGLYFFRDRFDKETITRNLYFYEPMTVHESSLSPCLHSILAARVGDVDMAYKLFLRASRLDLDDYNRETGEGLHITSMGGAWLTITEGFGGMSARDNKLHFSPILPGHWTKMSFRVIFRGSILKMVVERDCTKLRIVRGEGIDVSVWDKDYFVGHEEIIVYGKNDSPKVEL